MMAFFLATLAIFAFWPLWVFLLCMLVLILALRRPRPEAVFVVQPGQDMAQQAKQIQHAQADHIRALQQDWDALPWHKKLASNGRPR